MPSVIGAKALGRAAQAAFSGGLELALLVGSAEASDSGYRRAPVTLQGPELQPDGVWAMTNGADVLFAPFRDSSSRFIDGWALYDGEEELVRGDLAEPRMLLAGDQFVARAGVIRAGFRSE